MVVLQRCSTTIFCFSGKLRMVLKCKADPTARHFVLSAYKEPDTRTEQRLCRYDFEPDLYHRRKCKIIRTGTRLRSSTG